jgi:predicted O-methyltransferase YrrM
MINILESWLLPTDIGLEFGSGRSTSWFASRVNHLTSVENNSEWYQRIRKQIINKPVKYLLYEDGSNNSSNSGYVDVARNQLQNSLDFCLIDGTARDHCAFAILDKLKSGGILIIDDVERYIPRVPKTYSPNARSEREGYASEVWLQVGEQIKSWRSIWTTNGIKDTAFWVKP